MRYRELTCREQKATRRLITEMCANYDSKYGCLPLNGACICSAYIRRTLRCANISEMPYYL